MAISINFINISTNFLGKQTNNSDQGAIIRWPIVPMWPSCKKKCGLRKIYLEFAAILVK